jgi:hypothetical protein
MQRGLRAALVRGRPSTLWKHRDGTLILLHPRGGDSVEVPIAQLGDASSVNRHVLRLLDKKWASVAAINELREIAAGVHA